MTKEEFEEEFGGSYQEYALKAEAENRSPMAEGVWAHAKRLFLFAGTDAEAETRN